jgi:hypothetical protein
LLELKHFATVAETPAHGFGDGNALSLTIICGLLRRVCAHS